MSLSQWRQLQFYDYTPIRDPQLQSDTPLYSDPTLSGAALINGDEIILAYNSCWLKLANFKTATVKHFFKAFDDGYQITHVQVLFPYVVTIAEKLNSYALINIYTLEKLPNDQTHFHAQVTLRNGNNTYPISVVSISSDLSCIAVGYTDGKIILVRGDLARDRGSHQRIIYQDKNNEPITSLFLDNSASKLYAATTTRILLFSTLGKNKGLPDRIIANRDGVQLHCSAFNRARNEFICYSQGRIEMFKFEKDHNGDNLVDDSIAFDVPGLKRLESVSENDILLVVEETEETEQSLAIKDLSQNFGHSDMKRIIILDIVNKLVALNIIVTSSIIDAFSIAASHDESIYLLTSDGSLCKFSPKTSQEKLDIVVQKKLFPLALELAEQYQLSSFAIEKLHKSYGDFLFKKGKTKKATEQYVQCLNVVDTSEMITKFGVERSNDYEGIENLTTYLLALIKLHPLPKNYVTLLLIVLIKIDDIERLNKFVDCFMRSGIYVDECNVDKYVDLDEEQYFYADGDLFDLPLILELLRDSKRFDIALKIARKFSKDSKTVVEILLYDLQNPKAALRYMNSLPIDEVLRVIVVFSKDLLELLPNDTNALLIDVFTGIFNPTEYTEYETSSSESSASSTKETGSYSEHDHERTSNLVFYSYRTFFKYMNRISEPDKSARKSINAIPTYHPPRPTIVFTSFLTKPFEFVVFLEACLESYQRFEGYDDDKQVILTTLYDLYLSLVNSDVAERQEDWIERSRKVLAESQKLVKKNSESHPVDNSLMTLITHMNEIKIGDDHNGIHITDTEDLTDKTAILSKFKSMTLTEPPKLTFKFFCRYRELVPDLYRAALSYFSSSVTVLDSIGGEDTLRTELLKPIMEKDILSMLDLIQILSATNAVTFGAIKDLLLNHIHEEEKETHKNEKLVESYKEELLHCRTQLVDLIDPNNAAYITLRNQNCYQCLAALEIPLVFFKCGHLYHQRCLNEELDIITGGITYKCPKCITELEKANKWHETQEEVKRRSDLFEIALNSTNENHDKFRVITDSIGKGVLETTRAID